jgi:osmotically inducible protein OsmC
MSRHRASAVWSGSLPTGTGSMTLGAAGPSIGFTLNARVTEEAGTNPEQMVGAALAGCYSMALTNLIEETGVDADTVTVSTSAITHLEQTPAGFAITRIDLTTRGTVPGMAEAIFVELAEQAKTGCPVSKLYASAEITLDAGLA